jgi:hypothetical protein
MGAAIEIAMLPQHAGYGISRAIATRGRAPAARARGLRRVKVRARRRRTVGVLAPTAAMRDAP